jgi:hypothetical protein
VTGQPGGDHGAAADEGRSSGNWGKAVDGRDTGPDPDTGPGREVKSSRDAGPRQGTRPGPEVKSSQDAGPRQGTRPGPEVKSSREARPGQETRPGRDAGPGRDGGQPRPPRPPGPPGPPGIDLTGEIQRWLIRSGARSMRRELGEQFRKAWTGQRAEPTEPGDVWNTATTEPPPELSEAPECAWCPVCRAARRIRESGPGLGGQLAGAGDAVAAAVQEALSAFDSVLSARPRTEPAGQPAPPATDDRPEAPAPGAPSEGPDREPDDRD